MSEKRAENRENGPTCEINTAWTSSHERGTRPCPFGRIEARLTQVDYTRPCPCRA
ncbi:Protein phosphatase 1G [Gossypium arboreum]|uniref:Protein phosphatase 1G n=1 Tax=Gossypium arboreum TaxID=29729 RepID=A0A0B0NR76_GOSAR|nr:Protein phosphatase 1G [Gossypium arboreum]